MSKKKDELLKLAKKRFKLSFEAERKNRELMIEDLKFASGDQWHGSDRRARETDGRPVITVNRMGQFVKNILGDIRQNSPGIKVRGVEDSDKEGAEIMEGLIRHIEQQSKAKQAYIGAADYSVKCGYGAFRIVTDFVSDDVFEQDIFIKRIRNPFTTYSDPTATEITKSDGRYWFVTETISYDEFESRYPKVDRSEWNEDSTGINGESWYSEDKVRVAEYWVKEPITKQIALLTNGETVCLDELTDDAAAQYQAQGVGIERQRTAQSHKVVQYIITGTEILEDAKEFPSKYIPIIPVYGEEENIEGEVNFKGIVRDAKDPQRLYNYWRTTAAETIALQPKIPTVMTVEQIRGHEARWKQANRANLPYLLYNPDNQAPPPSRQPPPQPPAAMWQEASIASDDMKAATGIYDSAIGAQSNETSGRAILARQRQSDTSNFVYSDNLASAIEYCGRILVDMIPKVYDSQRVVRIVGEDDVEKSVTINQDANGVKYNDITKGKYDVKIVTGPSYATKRMEAADSMIQFVQAMPQVGQVAGDLIAKSMDWPGAEEIAERLRNSIPPNVTGVDEDDPDAKAQAEAQADKSAALEDLQMQVTMKEKGAEIAQKEAKAAKDAADAQLKQLEIAQQNGDMAGIIQDAVQQAVASLVRPPEF